MNSLNINSTWSHCVIYKEVCSTTYRRYQAPYVSFGSPGMFYLWWEEKNKPQHEHKRYHSNCKQEQFLPESHKWLAQIFLNSLSFYVGTFQILFLFILNILHDFIILFKLHLEIVSHLLHSLCHLQHLIFYYSRFISFILEFVSSTASICWRVGKCFSFLFELFLIYEYSFIKFFNHMLIL